jgi:nicotinate-nucleotide pyrophosphorylase (carboxylating)
VPTPPAADYLRVLVATALTEDLGGDPGHDVTSEATVAPSATATVTVRSRATGVAAGGIVWPPVLAEAARRTGGSTPEVETLVTDGSRITPGTELARLTGHVRSLLAAERTGLNLVGRASGIATATRAWADALEGTGVQVLDTRKTPPGLRAWDKYAVRCGGGTNKRFGLYDVAMIKDNHVAAAGGVAEAVRAVLEHAPGVALQVEVEDVEQALAAVGAGARFLMCDNMPPPLLRAAVDAARALARDLDGAGGTLEIEATGGLRLDSVAAVAAAGVDYVSVGALTHSAPVLDIGLDWGS